MAETAVRKTGGGLEIPEHIVHGAAVRFLHPLKKVSYVAKVITVGEGIVIVQHPDGWTLELPWAAVTTEKVT